MIYYFKKRKNFNRIKKLIKTNSVRLEGTFGLYPYKKFSHIRYPIVGMIPDYTIVGFHYVFLPLFLSYYSLYGLGHSDISPL